MRSQFLWLLAGLHSAIATYSNPAPLKNEHPGQIFKSSSGSTCCVDGVVNTGNSTGRFANINGTSTYLAYPPGRNPKTGIAILYLTDIFGVQLVNNRILADSLAQAGYFVLMPDLFNGDPVPSSAMGSIPSTFNFTAWSSIHTQEAVSAIVSSSIHSLRTQFGAKKIGAVGYCFGGKYVARFLVPGGGLDAGFTAHPSGVTAGEWANVTGPLSIAFGALDTSNTPSQRTAAESIFISKNLTFQTSLYSNAEHGFAVRTDLSNPQKKFAQESAYFQAVRWFDAWIK